MQAISNTNQIHSHMVQIKNAYVRRGLKVRCWVVTDSAHETAHHELVSGLMTQVTFDGQTVPIQGYGESSYGEVMGSLVAKTTAEHLADPKNSAFIMPEGIVSTAFARYSSGRGAFVAQVTLDSIAFKVTSCDCFLLMSDGTALCGWYKKPPEAL